MKKLPLHHYVIVIIALILLFIALLQTGACSNPDSSQPQQKISNITSDGLTIRYLTSPKQVQPSRQKEIVCVATDICGDALHYQWSATAGTIKPQEEPDIIQWLAPDKTGIYAITVIVSNTKGDKVCRSVEINVTDESPQHPVIYAVKCESCKNSIEASRFTEYRLRCDAVDPNQDELHYVWFTNLGKIKSNGNYATWNPGAQYGSALITVIVIDSKGNETEGYLAINVACCS